MPQKYKVLEKVDQPLAQSQTEAGCGSIPASGSDAYCPLKSLAEEVQRFQSTNLFTPMLVTHFYAQAACVVREVREARKIIKRLIKWDSDYPKKRVHSFEAEKEHDQIISDARQNAKRYHPNA